MHSLPEPSTRTFLITQSLNMEGLGIRWLHVPLYPISSPINWSCSSRARTHGEFRASRMR